jgi:hypothetical protein
MNNKNISACLLACCFIAVACNNEDKQKPMEAPKDSVAVVPPGNGANDPAKPTDNTASAKKEDGAADIPKKAAGPVKTATEKVKSSPEASADATKKAIHKADSAASAKKEIFTSTDDKLLPASAADNSKSFAPKYGIIPRDANENNIATFKNAFPDKRTLIKINFDAEPDAEMQGARTQIMNALKKAGYSNVSDKSQVFHPARMPKEIHYELQRDGSVIIWLQPENPQ